MTLEDRNITIDTQSPLLDTTTTKWHNPRHPVINKSWYLHGRMHRYYGPAYTPPDRLRNELRLRHGLDKNQYKLNWFLNGEWIKDD
jgi:hypothetical protein